MLHLILSRDWVEGRDAVLSWVADDVKNAKGGRILMVPELISHDMERRLCASAGDKASLYAEVLSFTRLARRVSEQVGSAAQECLDNGGRVVAMAAAARQLHSKLKAYAAVETRPEFLSELVDAVDEFKRCCITSNDLLAASRQTEGGLAQKLEELSLLLETYDSLCQRGKRDPRDQMNWLLEQLEEGDFAHSHVFYIDGFPDFTRQHMAILEHLIKYASDVTVSLNCDSVDTHTLAFEKAAATGRQLIDCAKRAGVPVKITTLKTGDTPLRSVRELLFQGRVTQQTDLHDKLFLCRADSLYHECLGAVQRVLTLVRRGCRYRDISIVCTDMGAYRDMLSLAFHRSGIPLYLSGTEDILQKTVITTVLSALDAALGGFQRDEVLRYLKSMLSPLDLDICDKLENYAIMWSINGRKWHSEWTNHPDGLDGDWTPAAQKTLQELNAARETALTPLFNLQQGFRDAVRLSDQIRALYAFLEDLQLAERLQRLADRLDAEGDNRAAQILNQLWEILLTAMEQMHDVLGDTSWDSEVFTRLFTLLLSQYDVGTIPPVLDAVMAGPVSAMRCQQEKHLILLGAVEGALPGYGGAKGVLTDQERVALRELGVPLTGGNMEGLQAEFAEIYGVFCGAGETVTVFCPAGQPSFVYRRLSQLVEQEISYVPADWALVTSKEAAGAYLAHYDAAEAAKQLQVEEYYYDTCRRRDYSLGSVGKDHISALYGNTLNLSASQVDKQADCRLAYFLRYGLRARERKEITVDPAEFGTYVHAVLEQTARHVMELGGFHQVSLEDTLKIAQKYSDEYAEARFSQIESRRVAYLLHRNLQELEMVVRELWLELSNSRFEPVEFELSFGSGNGLSAIPIEGKQMPARLRGFVDRVDVWKEGCRNYFRVVDYKTGSKDFDYCDVFNGLGLQMLLYLFALEQEGASVLGKNPIPAGVQYFSARSPLISSDGRLTDEDADSRRGKDWKRKGLVLLDEDVLDAMEPEGSPKRLSCRRNKDGELSGDLADRDQFRMLKRYILSVLQKMVDEIASGVVSPNPYTRGTSHNACDYCPYKGVCHPASVEGRRNYKAMTSQRFWEEVEKETSHG